jgi:predicted nucleic acid-binding protein
MKIFWDTNIFIYLLERHPVFHAKVLALHAQYRAREDQLITSALTLGELLAKPLRSGRADLADRYRELLTGGSVELASFDQMAAGHYARIRAATTLRQPDAIQLACAAATGCALFVTNDRDLWNQAVPGIESIRGL